MSWAKVPEKVVEVEGPSERQVEPWGRSRPLRRRCTSSGYFCTFKANWYWQGDLALVNSHFLVIVFFSCRPNFPPFPSFVVSSLLSPVAVSIHTRRREREQLAALKQHHQEEIDHHKKEIERLQCDIDRHKGKIRKLKHDDWLPSRWQKPFEITVFAACAVSPGLTWMCGWMFCKCLKVTEAVH